MRILLCLPSLSCGGAESHVLSLAGDLIRARDRDRTRDEVVILSSGGAMESEIPAGVRHIRFPARVGRFLSWRRDVACMARILSQIRPDVVHAHARYTARLCRAALDRLARGGTRCGERVPPLCVTAHALFSAGFAARRLSVFGDSFSYGETAPGTVLPGTVPTETVGTIAVSNDIARHLVGRFGLSPAEIAVIPNGIGNSFFEVGKARLYADVVRPKRPERGLRILFMSRLDRDCSLGAALLIDLFSTLTAAFPGYSLTLTIAGGGDALPELRRRAGDEPRIEFTGQVRSDAFFAARGRDFDLFVGVSRAALEAAACGIPVILCGNEGFGGPLTPEIFPAASRTNFCARGEAKPTAKTLMKAIVGMLSHPSPEDTRAVFERVRRDFSSSVMTARTREIYEKLIAAADGLPRHCTASYAKSAGAAPVRSIDLVGYYGHGNLGDEWIAAKLSAYLKRLFPNARLRVGARRVGGRRVGGRRVGVRRVGGSKRSKTGRAGADRASGSDWVVLGGGTLLQDLTSRRSLWYYLWRLTRAHLAGKRTAVLCGGVGPLCRRSSRFLCSRVLPRVDFFVLRDGRSADLLAALGVPREKIRLGADAVFLPTPSDPTPDTKAHLAPEANTCACQTGGNAPYLLLAPTTDLPAVFWQTLARFCRQNRLSVRVLPCFPTQDLPFCRSAVSELRRRRIDARMTDADRLDARILAGRTPGGYLSGCVLVLAQRLHGFLLGVSAGVPALALAKSASFAQNGFSGTAPTKVSTNAPTSASTSASTDASAFDPKLSVAARELGLPCLSPADPSLAFALQKLFDTRTWLGRFLSDRCRALSTRADAAVVRAFSETAPAGEKKKGVPRPFRTPP